jgi:uncharacterized protein YgiM (DUF1202 family)
MSLTSCPECKRSISNKANNCPHCGYPIGAKKRKSSNGCLIPIIAGIIVGLLIIIIPHKETETHKYEALGEYYANTSLNVRSRASTNSTILETLKTNEKVLLSSSKSNGFSVILNRDSTFRGWCADKHLQHSPVTLKELETRKQKRLEEKQKNKSNKTTSPKQSSLTNSSLAYKLASVEKNDYVKKDDILTNRFQYLLNSLDRKYTDSKQQIADRTVRAQELLKEYGINESLRNIMEGMNTLNDPKDKSKFYAEYTTVYVIIRKENLSHNKTIDSIQQSIDLIGIDGLTQAAGLK